MNPQPALLEEEPIAPADARLLQVMEKIVEEYGGDIGAYIEALRRRNPLPPPLASERGSLHGEARNFRRRTI